MANSHEKQKEKIILNLITEKTKIEMSLSSLKESLLKLQEGKDGRQEIVMAVNKAIAQGEKYISAEKLERNLYTADMLPLDFVIRTSGENRTSNFLPWQATYSEWYFPKKLWPSFTKKDLIKAIKVYMGRNRRFGAIKV